MRTVLVLCVALSLALLTVGAGAQTTGSGAVVVGQDAQGRNIVLRVIPLKYMDAAVAAQLFGGWVINAGGSPSISGGEADRGYQRRSSGSSRDQGYTGYQDARRQSDAYPGYRSPYGNR